MAFFWGSPVLCGFSGQIVMLQKVSPSQIRISCMASQYRGGAGTGGQKQEGFRGGVFERSPSSKGWRGYGVKIWLGAS